MIEKLAKIIIAKTPIKHTLHLKMDSAAAATNLFSTAVAEYISAQKKDERCAKKMVLCNLIYEIHRSFGDTIVAPATFGKVRRDGLQPTIIDAVPFVWCVPDDHLEVFVCQIVREFPKRYPVGSEVVILKKNADPRKLSDWLRCFVVGVWRVCEDGVVEKIKI